MSISEQRTILHLAAPSEVGGLESVLLELTSGLRQSGHQVALAAVLKPGRVDHPILSQAEARGVEVLRLAVPARRYALEIAKIRDAIRAVQPDVVHTHGYRADILGGWAANRSGVPWVSTAHGFAGGSYKNRFYEWLQTLAYRRAQAVVSVSRPIVRRLVREGVSEGQIVLLPNALGPRRIVDRAEARKRLGVPQGGFRVGWVGRLSPEKGADVLLSSLALLDGVAWHASILGDGVERERLANQAAALGLTDRVRWHGNVADAYLLFHAFDAFVLSSRTEGTPMALLEAVAAGVPSVATAVGGVPDMFDGSEITLVSSESPSEIADAVRTIFSHPSAATAKSAAAHAKLQRQFDPASWLDAHCRLYDRVCKQRAVVR